MNKISLLLAECNQGQKKKGVEEGGKFLFKNIVDWIQDVMVVSRVQTIPNHLFDLWQKGTNVGYRLVYEKMLEEYDVKNHLPILVGGDHSVASGSISAFLEKYKDVNTHVFWIDAFRLYI